MAGLTLVRVLDEDPELGSALAPAQLERARIAAVAPLLVVDRGSWEAPPAPRHARRDLGLLVLAGLLRRDLEVAGRVATELRGPDDLLRPWDDVTDVASVGGRIAWTAIEPTRLAWLDGEFADAVAPWPRLMAAVLERAVRRARLMSFRLAIGELRHVHLRVLLLLWHLSDRWGRVRPDGVHLDLRLTHDLIARMVGAHRTSVTVALRRLAAEGRVARSPAGQWVLLGGPPEGLDDLRH
jgi:CRP/FNR family cyclic AMP-dependent transcriptional regulator